VPGNLCLTSLVFQVSQGGVSPKGNGARFIQAKVPKTVAGLPLTRPLGIPAQYLLKNGRSQD
jgi:hypothetical protein